VALWRTRAPGLRFARVLLVLAVSVAVLPSLIPAAWGSWKSPLPLRNPEKFAVAIVLSLAIFAGRGFDAFRRLRPRGAVTAGIVLAALAAGAALFPAGAGRLAAAAFGGVAPFPDRAAAWLPFALASAGLLWMATVVGLELARRPGRGGASVAVVLLTAVPIAANRPIARTVPDVSILGPTAFARRIAKEDPEGRFRTLGGEIYRSSETPRNTRYGDGWETARQDWIYYSPVLWHRGMVFNYDFDEGDLARVESLRKISGYAASSPEASAFFGTFALKWCVRTPAQRPLAGYRKFGGNAAQDWDRHEQPFPDMRLATQWSEVKSALAAASRIGTIPPGGILVETGGNAAGRAAPGRLRIERRTPSRMELVAETPEPTWLFVLRAFWNHRRVAVDGKEAETFPANIAFTAVAVPAGNHRISWEELLPGWEVSRLGPLAFGMILAAGGVLSLRNRKP
jgi:hypothetical protein